MTGQIVPKEHSLFEKLLFLFITISFASFFILRNTPAKVVCNIGLYSSVVVNMMSKTIRLSEWISAKTKMLWWCLIVIAAVSGGLFAYDNQSIWSISLLVAIAFFTINHTIVYNKLASSKKIADTL